MILGIDEVGRGPWAGPLVVGAVILGENFPDSLNLTDSKKLTAKKRENLEPLILEHSAAYGLGWVSAAELDQIGLSASLKLATRRAIKAIFARIPEQNPATPENTISSEDENPKKHQNPTSKITIDQIIIDGTVNFLKGTPLEDRVSTLPKADFLVREVSAASIIAKVARDRYMTEIALQCPAYGFEKHVGYGTALHKKALLEHGLCPEHRKSFRPVREIFEKTSQNCEYLPKNPKNIDKIPENPSNTTLKSSRSADNPKPPSSSQKGQTAELAVASYLKTQNHQIIAHNFKTKTYEIDLISVENREIFFTEVKYSRNPASEGTPLVRITPKKQQQMRFAAECFLSAHPKYRNLSPILAAASVSDVDYKVNDWFTLD